MEHLLVSSEYLKWNMEFNSLLMENFIFCAVIDIVDYVLYALHLHYTHINLDVLIHTVISRGSF